MLNQTRLGTFALRQFFTAAAAASGRSHLFVFKVRKSKGEEGKRSLLSHHIQAISFFGALKWKGRRRRRFFYIEKRLSEEVACFPPPPPLLPSSPGPPPEKRKLNIQGPSSQPTLLTFEKRETALRGVSFLAGEKKWWRRIKSPPENPFFPEQHIVSA